MEIAPMKTRRALLLLALAAGVTEYEVYGAFMGRMYELGSEGDGFYPFLSSGPVTEGALYPTNRVLQEGDSIVMDFTL